MRRRRHASVVVVWCPDRGAVLLVERTDGRWASPGGYVDRAERPRCAAARELYEETGLLVNPALLRYFSTFERFPLTLHAYVLEAPAWLARLIAVPPNDEVRGGGWFELSALPANLHSGDPLRYLVV